MKDLNSALCLSHVYDSTDVVIPLFNNKHSCGRFSTDGRISLGDCNRDLATDLIESLMPAVSCVDMNKPNENRHEECILDTLTYLCSNHRYKILKVAKTSKSLRSPIHNDLSFIYPEISMWHMHSYILSYRIKVSGMVFCHGPFTSHKIGSYSTGRCRLQDQRTCMAKPHVSYIYNSDEIADSLSYIISNAAQLMSSKAFLWQYTREGTEEMEINILLAKADRILEDYRNLRQVYQ